MHISKRNSTYKLYCISRHWVCILCILYAYYAYSGGTEADTVCVPVDSTSCYVCILRSYYP